MSFRLYLMNVVKLLLWGYIHYVYLLVFARVVVCVNVLVFMFTKQEHLCEVESRVCDGTCSLYHQPRFSYIRKRTDYRAIRIIS